jgi:hypothetical protein
VKIRTADTAAVNLDVDVVLSPLLGLEVAPLHLALDGILILSEPSLEFGVCRHCDVRCLLSGIEEFDESWWESKSQFKVF